MVLGAARMPDVAGLDIAHLEVYCKPVKTGLYIKCPCS